MFKTEGEIEVTITDAILAEPKFPTGSGKNDNSANHLGESIAVWGDIVLKLEDKNGNFDYWRGELSNRSGIGNFSDKTRLELTIKTLNDIGFAVADWNALWEQIDDNGELPNLKTGEYRAIAVIEKRHDEKTNKDYYYVKYLNGINASRVARVNKSTLYTMMQAGGYVQQQNQPQAQAAPVPAPAPTPAQPQQPVYATPPPPPMHQTVPAPTQAAPAPGVRPAPPKNPYLKG